MAFAGRMIAHENVRVTPTGRVHIFACIDSRLDHGIVLGRGHAEGPGDGGAGGRHVGRDAQQIHFARAAGDGTTTMWPGGRNQAARYRRRRPVEREAIKTAP